MKEAVFYISGMSCQACSSGIERALRRRAFVKEAEVYLLSHRARVVYDEGIASLEEIFAIISKLGYTPSLDSIESPLDSMESTQSTPATQSTQDSQASFHADSHALTNSQNPHKPQATAQAASPAQPRAQDFQKRGIIESLLAPFHALNALIESLDSRLLPERARLPLAALCSSLVLALSWGEMFLSLSLPYVTPICALLSLVVMHLGRRFYLRGFKALLARNPTMDSLIAISTTAAFVYSLLAFVDSHAHAYFDSVCVILTLVLVGKRIEERSKEQAFSSARALLELHQKPLHKIADSATPLATAKTREIPSGELRAGECFRVLEGEMVLVDGEVIEGAASVECSAINGESLPFSVGAGDSLPSGSVVIAGVLVLRASKSARDSTLAQILGLIQSAQESKAPIASLADRVAAVFVPLVMILAVCAGAFWWGYEGFERGLSVCIATLVISCPCALGLATPMALLHAHNLAHTMGVFFKNAKALQAMGEITHLTLDKSGTLTQGLEIESILPYRGDEAGNVGDKASDEMRDELFALALSLESHSTHIIAQAFRAHSLASNAPILPIREAQSVLGSGVRAWVEFRGEWGEYWLGNADMLPRELLNRLPDRLPAGDCPSMQPPSESASEAPFESTAKSPSFERAPHLGAKLTLYLARLDSVDSKNARILARFVLKDHIKADAKPTLEAFRAQGIEACIISGDSRASTEILARELGVGDFHAQAKPQDKLALLELLSARGQKVAMVGDGINDAPALARAHASLAFASPQELAAQNADIILYNPQCKGIYRAYALSRATISNIKGNLVFAFCYNVAFIPLAMGVLGGFGIFLHPMFCALAMSASSLSVIANAARLKRFKIE